MAAINSAIERAIVSDILNTHTDDHNPVENDPNRRDFIYIATGAAVAVGAGALAWPMVNQMSAAADTLAAGSVEIDLTQLEEGQQLRVLWRGKPVFVRYRTAAEIAEAESVEMSALKDPETDEARLIPGPDGNLKPQFLVMVGVCTHFGCVPVDEAGDYDGWYCPCHGSHYDTSGRIRKGPAPTNLVVPEYVYVSDTTIKVG